MNQLIFSNLCPQPDTCRFTGCQGECAQALPAAAKTSSSLIVRELESGSRAGPTFKRRDSQAQRRLLVAAP